MWFVTSRKLHFCVGNLVHVAGWLLKAQRALEQGESDLPCVFFCVSAWPWCVVPARRAWEKIEKEAEQLVAAARVTRTDHHAPFRAKLYPSAPLVDDGGGSGGGGLVDVVRDNWDDSSEDEEEEPVDGAGDSVSDEEAEDDETEREKEPRLQDSHEDDDQAQGQEEKEEKSAPRGTGDDVSTASPGPGASAAAAAAVPIAVTALAAAATPSSTGAGKRHSKWGNSAIRGRLSRPSDGRATMMEQEAAARQERLEKLRCVERKPTYNLDLSSDLIQRGASPAERGVFHEFFFTFRQSCPI